MLHSAANGFVTAVISYRLSPEVKHPVHTEDSLVALKWLRSHASDFNADPESLVLMGNSAGGHISGLIALSPEFSAVEDGRPTVSAPWLKGVALISPPTDIGRMFGSSLNAATFDGIFEWTEDQAYYERVSPVTMVTEEAALVPWYIANATRDYHLHLDALDLLTQLDQVGAKVEYLMRTSDHNGLTGLRYGLGHADRILMKSMWTWARKCVEDHPGLETVDPVVDRVSTPIWLLGVRWALVTCVLIVFTVVVLLALPFILCKQFKMTSSLNEPPAPLRPTPGIKAYSDATAILKKRSKASNGGLSSPLLSNQTDFV